MVQAAAGCRAVVGMDGDLAAAGVADRDNTPLF